MEWGCKPERNPPPELTGRDCGRPRSKGGSLCHLRILPQRQENLPRGRSSFRVELEEHFARQVVELCEPFRIHADDAVVRIFQLQLTELVARLRGLALLQ